MALDRRQYPRHSPNALVYVNLGANNEGMLLNLSQGGLAFQVVTPVERDARPRFLCVLGGEQRLEAMGEVTWTSETRKTGGLQFTDLPEGSRKLIADWLVNLPLWLPAEAAPEPPPEPRPAAQQTVSLEAEAGTTAAATPPREHLEVPQELEAHAPPQPADSGATAPARDWPPLTPYDWLEEPAKKRHLRRQVTPGAGHTIEWVLAAGCVFLAVAALLAWATVFRSLDRRARQRADRAGEAAAQRAKVTGAATNAPTPQTENASASVTPRKSAATPPPLTAGTATGAATSNQSAKAGVPSLTAGAASSPRQAATKPVPDTAHQPANPEAAPSATPPTGAPPQPGEKELVQALRYLDGAYGRKDTAAAVTWFWQAVAKGNQEAAVRLAGLYLRGEGVERSCDQARVLLTTAAQKGNAEAAKRLETLPAAGCR